MCMCVSVLSCRGSRDGWTTFRVSCRPYPAMETCPTAWLRVDMQHRKLHYFWLNCKSFCSLFVRATWRLCIPAALDAKEFESCLKILSAGLIAVRSKGNTLEVFVGRYQTLPSEVKYAACNMRTCEDVHFNILAETLNCHEVTSLMSIINLACSICS